MSGHERAFVAVAVIAIACFAVLIGTILMNKSAERDSCRDAGGVLVRGRGDAVCIDRNVVIDHG